MRSILFQWGLLAVALVCAVMLTLYGESGSRHGARVYTVHQVVVGLKQQPGHWLGRTVWVRGAWAGLCQPYPHAGCVVGEVGQSVSYLAASAWNHDEMLPLVGSTDPGNPPGRWVGQMRSQQVGVYQVRLVRLDSLWCPAIDGGYGVDGEAREATSACLGGELVP